MTRSGGKNNGEGTMSETGYGLVVGDKNYSSWSLRPWLLMRMFAIPFNEINVDIYRPGTRARILEHSPSGKVPALKTGNLTIWDTMAIIEYLAEHYPGLAIWPQDAEARAMARVVSAEMHSGFDALRSKMPMDMTSSKPVEGVSKEVARDVARIVELWRMCRKTYGSSNSEAVGQGKTSGGDFLFGDFCAADAMFAPVTSRFRTYGIDLGSHGDDGICATYCDTILSLPEIGEWTQAGRNEMSERGVA
jgi:glutathione S-transferase